MKLTELLAIYGAFLSTVVFFWNFVRTRPRFKVKAVVSVDKADPTRFAGAEILVQNVSTTVVHISRILILYPYKEEGTLLERIKYVLRNRALPLCLGWMAVRLQDHGVVDGCPIVLDPGKIHQVFVPRKVFKEMPYFSGVRREIRVLAQDAFWGNREYSNLFRVPVFKDTAPVNT